MPVKKSLDKKSPVTVSKKPPKTKAKIKGGGKVVVKKGLTIGGSAKTKKPLKTAISLCYEVIAMMGI
jgi:hypothetical protein